MPGHRRARGGERNRAQHQSSLWPSVTILPSSATNIIWSLLRGVLSRLVVLQPRTQRHDRGGTQNRQVQTFLPGVVGHLSAHTRRQSAQPHENHHGHRALQSADKEFVEYVIRITTNDGKWRPSFPTATCLKICARRCRRGRAEKAAGYRKIKHEILVINFRPTECQCR